MPNITPQEQEVLDFIRASGAISNIKNASFTFHRDIDQTKWENSILPLGGEYRLEDHTPAYTVNNLGKVKYVAVYEAAGFTTIIKFGEKQNRGKEPERRVTIKATICRDTNGLYLFVRLYSIDGLYHQAGEDFLFDSRIDQDLYQWVIAKVILSGATKKLPMTPEYLSHPA